MKVQDRGEGKKEDKVRKIKTERKMVCVSARGVLSIKLLSFENKPGLTYEGECCDPTPQDGATCHNQCDYVLRLVVSGLGRANDHVFLFHEPLEYDKNNLHFQHHGSNVTLTVLFDSWPTDGPATLYAFFYDYDESDHTTALVDWFETELDMPDQSVRRSGHSGQYHQVLVRGNRHEQKTRLAFEWSRECGDSSISQDDDHGCYNPPSKHQLQPRVSTQPGNKNDDINDDADKDSEQQPDRLEGPTSKDENLEHALQEHGSKEERIVESPFKPFKTNRNKDREEKLTSFSPKPEGNDPMHRSVPKEKDDKNAREGIFNADGDHFHMNGSKFVSDGSRFWYGTAIRSSSSDSGQSSLQTHQMSVETVFSRYWPAILGVTVGTVFLVVAVLTSIACRQQRLMAQRRRRWQQDTPHHVTTPPPASGLHSPSTTSVSS
ncbi:hypothetical protein ACOMHN_031615 [Nucella lapillus]